MITGDDIRNVITEGADATMMQQNPFGPGVHEAWDINHDEYVRVVRAYVQQMTVDPILAMFSALDPIAMRAAFFDMGFQAGYRTRLRQEVED